jgi:sigma-B regulation protein RsbU (phosphoserine phosphatase)
LIDNAIQFRHKERKLTIEISSVGLDENLYRVSTEKYRFAEHIRLCFSDNGVGFNMDYKTYVVELLTKIDPQSKGLGIGLSLINKIVTNHAGTLQIESEEGKGTAVCITLPKQSH